MQDGDCFCLERSRSWTVVGIDHTDDTDHLSQVWKSPVFWRFCFVRRCFLFCHCVFFCFFFIWFVSVHGGCWNRDELVTLFFEEPFMQAIQTNCPWLLRYLVTAIILTKVSYRGCKPGGGGGDANLANRVAVCWLLPPMLAFSSRTVWKHWRRGGVT